ncbi:MAG TPA: ABC transporter substrate-binding protein [Polyangiaceae bacterium]
MKRLLGTCAAVLAIAAFVGVSACSKRSASDNPAADAGTVGTQLTLALNWVPEPEFGGFYAAREGGAYRRQGLNVDIMGGGAGVPVVQMVATGRVDFGTVGGDEVIVARARGADVVAVFATFQTSPQGIMVHASRKFESLRDVFRSGTLAIEPGLPYAAFLKKQFDWEGVEIVPYDGGVARFLADPTFAQQCYVTSEPIAAQKQGSDPQVFLIADAGFNPYATVVITRRELVAQKPEMVAAFVAATAEGWRSYLVDPEPTNAVIARLNPSMDAVALKAAADAQKPLIETEHTRRSGLGSMTTDRWEILAKQLLELRIIERAPTVSEIFVRVGVK